MPSLTLTELRLMKIVWVGVRVKQNNDIYITRIENFFDRNKTKFVNFERRGGAPQRYLPIKHFHHTRSFFRQSSPTMII